MTLRRRILVVTTVHHPEDARIRHRQIGALLRDGWDVTYAAPFTGYRLPPPLPATIGPGRLRCIDLPRARGRRRLRATCAARRLVRREAPYHDVVLLHDPDLLLAVVGLRQRNLVWDVHEDTAAAIRDRPWVPAVARGLLAWGVRRVEGWAERRMPLLLAEHAYQQRFSTPHPVVPNTVRVPDVVGPPTQRRVVYLGSITIERGAAEVVELARLLREHGEWRVDVMGDAHGEARELLAAADREGTLRWNGYVPSNEALAKLDGAVAGLSLLRDVPNYRHSMPTKVIEYMAHGVPVVTTPLPLPAELVTKHGAGLVVPFEDARAAVEAVLRLATDRGGAAAMGAAGHRAAREHYDWAVAGAEFTAVMREIAAARSPRA